MRKQFNISYIVTLVLIALQINMFSQETQFVFKLEKRVCDCSGAINLGQRLGPVVTNHRFGTNYEVHNTDGANPWIIKYEHNVVWYSFRAYKTGLLYLEIESVNISEDFNFMVYHYPGSWFCENFLEEFADNPMRSNLVNNGGSTGLNDSGEQDYNTINDGNTYSKPLQVYAGQLYYILVDTTNPESEGHTISATIQ